MPYSLAASGKGVLFVHDGAIMSLFVLVLISQDGSFTIHGMADLEDVCTSLAFQEVNKQKNVPTER